MIKVYNRNSETHDVNNFPIFRPNILGNPYTHITEKKTRACYVVGSREEAIEKYSDYYDRMYKRNEKFRAVCDEIYRLYRSGQDVFLECYCKPQPCHGDVIKKKMEERAVKDLLKKPR